MSAFKKKKKKKKKAEASDLFSSEVASSLNCSASVVPLKASCGINVRYTFFSSIKHLPIIFWEGHAVPQRELIPGSWVF